MKFFKYLSVTAMVMVLAACGGGGGNPGTTSGSAGPVITTPSEQPANVEVLTSANTLPSAIGSNVEITAFVKNSANVGMAGQTVIFSASSGTLQEPSAITDSSGSATAKLISGNDKSIRDIKVTVTAGFTSGSVVIPVSGTRVSIAGSGSLQAGGTATQYVIRAVDSSGVAIGGSKITVNSSLGNSLSAASLITDSTGNATFLYTPNNEGSDTLTISGLGTSANTVVIVNAIDFVVLNPASNTSIAIGESQIIRVKFKRSGAGVAGQTVAFSTTRGVFDAPTTTTDVNGEASARLSSTTAGPAVVVAQIPGIGTVNLPVQFVAIDPASIVVQSNPGGVLPNNPGTTINQSTIEAIVRDANGNAVANRQVNFTILEDLSNGTLSSGIATTDVNGRVQVQFIPGASSTAANGVRIQAEVASTTINAVTALTVNGRSLFITMAFGNTIGSVDETTYSKEFSVYVTDANGVAIGNQLITLAVIPTEYSKGTLSNCTSTISAAGATVVTCGGTWGYSSMPTVCANEDLNFNGILDAVPFEDRNRNGQLTPGNIALAAPGNVVTDAAGRATFAVQYGEQFAPWVKVNITARASVAGTESRQSILYDLVGSVPDFTGEAPPAGATSPFGSSTSCTNSN